MKAFFDTNILIYAQSTDHRKQRALDLISLGGVISVQVLNEFANVLHRKLGRNWDEISLATQDVRDVFEPVLSLTPDDHVAALGYAKAHQVAFYDALILAVARRAECDVFFSEDFQNGRQFGPLRIVNPFLSEG